MALVRALVGYTAIVALAFGSAVAAETRTPSITITGPSPGSAPIKTAYIPVIVSTQNFMVECKDAGQAPKPGRGHIHAMLDGMSMEHMANLYCSDNFSVSGAGLKPGKHMLVVALANDDHEMVGKPATVSFDYEPATTVPLPKPLSGARPVLTILSPKNGAAVDRTFDLNVAVTAFHLSCDLEGKPNVAGYGHLHVFVNQGGSMHAMDMGSMKQGESMKGSMKQEEPMKGGTSESMAMPGMISMPCVRTIPVDLSAWKSGKTQLTVMAANNDHMPTKGSAPASVTVTLK
jgi:hypothetical protein